MVSADRFLEGIDSQAVAVIIVVNGWTFMGSEHMMQKHFLLCHSVCGKLPGPTRERPLAVITCRQKSFKFLPEVTVAFGFWGSC